MLNWAKQFNIFCYLDNHQYHIAPHHYEVVLGAGAVQYVSADNSLTDLDRFLSDNNHWSFGHLSYGLKDRLLGTKQRKEDQVGFPDFFFFQPEIRVTLRNNELTIHAKDPQLIYDQIVRQQTPEDVPLPVIQLQQRLSREEYLDRVRQLQAHILRGDCYEINFCQEFFAQNVSLDAVPLFHKLTTVSPTPFSALYRLHDKYLVCASPERFLVKSGNKVFSQPMKGTARRNLLNPAADEQLKKELYENAKERAENVMVVDLVRNDLSRICTGSSVKVDELFGIYSFPQVHQMVSTISGELQKGIRFSEIIAATFPMGSMTGAPKLKVMQLIDKYEPVARGLFSGSVGYMDDKGNFDFNVVIRSVLYNQTSQYLSYQVGSGITFYSDAGKEWEECLLKGEAIKKVLTG